MTRDSLNHADEIFDFFTEVAPSYLCFNIEEIEAGNSRSSLKGRDQTLIKAEFRVFMDRIVYRLRHASPVFQVREVDAVLGALRSPLFGKLSGNSQNGPGRILSIAWDGEFQTFSPELLGARHPRHGALRLGNVLFDDLPPRGDEAGFAAQRDEIARGVARCRDECKYFSFCLGGAPANKLGELGGFDATETMFCQLTQQTVIDVVLESLERDLVT